MATSYKEYTVKAGEHLMAIALEHLGSKTRYKEILDRDGKPLASETIHPGDVLRIPVTTTPPAPVPVPAPVPAPAPVSYFEYTVKAGDHLMAIALAHLGSKARFKEILDRNGKPLASETIYPGDVLRIPKK